MTRVDENAGPRLSANRSGTPEEALDAAYQRLRIGSRGGAPRSRQGGFSRLLSSASSLSSSCAWATAARCETPGRPSGKSGDGGIDGIIKEDRSGLDVIYVQAKRWDATVGRPEIQKFAGALQGHRARKGVFITTSTFSADAIEFAARIDSKIVLIDGAALAAT